jgi:DNA-binding transcriptional LysR family regulator
VKFRLIEVYRAMLECGTVTAAARSLRISQPAMTKLVAELQDELELALFERQGGRLVPTPEALTLKGSFDRAWRGVIELREAAKDVRDLRRGRLTVVAFPSFAQAMLPAFIAQFSGAANMTSIVLHSQSSTHVMDWIADGLADVGFAAILAPRSGVHVERLGSLRFVCAMPKDHRLAQRKVIRANDLRGEHFISLGDVDRSRSRIETAFEADAVEREIRLTTPQTALALALVAQGAGTALIDEATAKMADPLRVAIRPFEPKVSLDVYMYHPANRAPSQVLERFVREVRKWLKGQLIARP